MGLLRLKVGSELASSVAVGFVLAVFLLFGMVAAEWVEPGFFSRRWRLPMLGILSIRTNEGEGLSWGIV